MTDDPRGPPSYSRSYDRFDDRRRGGGYGRDDPYSYRGSRRDDDRGYGRRDRDEGYGAPRGIDRYAGGSRDDRYSSRGDDRRGGGGGYSDRYDRGGDRDGGRSSRDVAPAPAYGDPAPRGEGREPYGGRDYYERDSRRY